MSTDTATTPLIPAAAFIATSAHKGTWSRRIARPTADSFTAAELASIVTHGQALDPRTGEFCVWEASGHVEGTELFVRTRMVPQPGGWIACYDSDGRHILSHPADRRIRILTK